MAEGVHRPLGRFELAQLLTSEAAPLNAVTVLRLARQPPTAAFERTLAALQERYPLLRARIANLDGRPSFEAAPEVPALACEHGSLGSPAERDRLIEEELATPFDVRRGPLLRCRLLAAGEGSSELIVTFHHVVMDAVSGARVVEDLLALRSAPPKGAERAALPPPSEALYPPAYQGLGLAWRTAAYLARQAADELRYRLATRAGQPIDPAARNRVLSFEIGAELTHALSRRARQERLTLHAVLAAALLRATARRLYGEGRRPLRHVFFADLRPYLVPPPPAEQLAARHSLVRVTVDGAPRRDFWAFAALVERTVRGELARGGKFLSPYLAPALVHAARRQRKRRMATTALAYHGRQELGGEGGLEVLEHHTFVSNVPFGPRYTAQVRLNQKRLVWDVVYLEQDFGPAGAAAVVNEIRQILSAAT